MAYPFRRYPRFSLGALGDMWYRATNGDQTPVSGAKTEGYVPVMQADSTVAWGASGAGAMVPTFIASGDTFTVPVNRQALFAANIDNEGIIDAVGILIEVD